MGMSASQARLLTLYARQHDLEFQGQQINSARSQLATRSAIYTNQLLNMDVPTPPLKTDYTSLTYQYNYNGKEYTVNHIANIDDQGNATLTVQHTAWGSAVKERADKEVQVTWEPVKDPTTGQDTGERKYKINGQEPQGVDSITDEDKKAEIEKAIKQSGQTPEDYYVIANGDSYDLILKTDVMDNSDGAKVYYADYTENAIFEETINTKVKFDTNGRLCQINLGGNNILVEPIVTTDEFAYEDAMAQYTYEKQIYDKEQNRINAELEKIKKQDKDLELQLTQLDTERTQITTETEAVKKVLGENVERTYKTFSG